MKRMSLSRKIRLACARVSKYEALCWLYPLMFYIMLYINRKDPGFANGISFAVGITASAIYIFTVSNCFSNMKQFKAFPMTFKDIIDVSVSEIVVRAFAMAAGNSVLMLICRLPELVPYIACMFFAMAAVASLLIPFYMKTDLRTSARSDDPKINRINIFKAVSVIAIYMSLQAAIAAFTFRYSFASESLAGDVPVLAAIFAVSIVILMLIAKICGSSKKFSLEC